MDIYKYIYIYSLALGKIVGKIGFSTFGNATGFLRKKNSEFKIRRVLFRKICGTLWHHSFFISFSKKCGWLCTNIHHYKQITCVNSPTVHIFNPILGHSYHGRVHYIYIVLHIYTNPIGWGYRIHRQHLCWEVILTQRVFWYDTKQSDDKAPVMLCIMQSTPLLPSMIGSYV